MTWEDVGRVLRPRSERMDMGVPVGTFALLAQRLHDAGVPAGHAERPAVRPASPRRAASEAA